MKLRFWKFDFFKILKYIFLIFCALVVIYPLYFVLVSSLKTNDEIFMTPFNLPHKWNFFVYLTVWKNYDVNSYFLNSVYYAVVSVVISTFLGSMAAFAISRMKWKLSKLCLGLFVFGIMIPIHSELVPLYTTFTKFNVNYPKFTVLIIFIAFALPNTIFILSAYMKGISYEIEESAILDGCSALGLLWKIILPLTKPAISTVTIFNFLGAWNDFAVSLIFIDNESQKTLQLGITRFQGSFATQYSLLLAAIIIAIIPSMITYMFMQNKIVSGITAGAVKG